MTQAKLRKKLRSMVSQGSTVGYDAMVRQYGFDQVNKSLEEIWLTDQNAKLQNNGVAPQAGRQRVRSTATQYVEKMNIPSEKRPAMAELAQRFQDKSFLPSFGDVSNFCQNYGIKEPASRSRGSAMRRVFKFIASMETHSIQTILDRRLYSGPSRLETFSDAMRLYGRAARLSERANLDT